MASNYGPKIAADGLAICLDAANNKSYSGGGTNWNDISRNSNNATLTNGPIFSSVNAGVINFDGTNDYATRSINLSAYDQITVEVWLRPNNTSSSMIFEHSINWNNQTGGFGLNINSDGGSNVTNMCHTNHQSGAGGRNYQFTCRTDEYSCHVNIFSKIADATGRLTYVNGRLLNFAGGFYSTSTATTLNASAFQNHTMYLGSRAGSSSFFNGSIAIFKIYGRKLSASEIERNYKSTKGRFKL